MEMSEFIAWVTAVIVSIFSLLMACRDWAKMLNPSNETHLWCLFFSGPEHTPSIRLLWPFAQNPPSQPPKCVWSYLQP